MSLNEFTEEQLVALLRERLQCTTLATEEMAESEPGTLPKAIWEDLETTQEAAAKANITSFVNDLPQYEGGRWTKSGSLNRDLHGHVRQHKLDALSVITQKYRNGDRLRQAGRAATEIYEELDNFMARPREPAEDEEDLTRILERVRRLAVFSFNCGKAMDNEAKAISDKALGINSPDPYGETREMAYTPEEIEAWEEKRFRQSILRANTQRFQPFRGRGGYRGRFQKSTKNFFGKRSPDRSRPDHQYNQSPAPKE